jgi:hypothetical protein
MPLGIRAIRWSMDARIDGAAPLTDVKAFMGHAAIQTTMIYIHHVPQHDAAERLSALLDERTHRASWRTPGACPGLSPIPKRKKTAALQGF